jgi:radical SAM protein with 4Fe4S-binding SPASM domain
MENKKIVIFGAGDKGKKALDEFGSDNVYCFADNDKSKLGTEIMGKPVISFEDAVILSNQYVFVIAVVAYFGIIKQFENHGIYNYSIYKGVFRYFPINRLVVKQYKTDSPDHSEEEFNEYMTDYHKRSRILSQIDNFVESASKVIPKFRLFEIETLNRCNGICDFCPVSRQNETREYSMMSEELFISIINQLKEMDYHGALSLFSNNEPFLDKRMLRLCRIAKEALPNAYHFLFTNGKLLSLDVFIELMDLLDELIIDNYTADFSLQKTSQDIVDYIENGHEDLIKKVTVVVRTPHEVLQTRGGDAPNRKEMVSYGDAKCALLYEQMVVRPDGKVSLCCNDPKGKCTLGDLSKESIQDVWHGEEYNRIRELLYKNGRKGFWHCEYCDHFRV